MMLQTSFPGSIEGALFCVSDHGKENFLCDQMRSAETWQVCMNCYKAPLNWCREVEPMQEDRRIVDDPCSSNCPGSVIQPSTASTMTENNAPNLVYRRKKLRKNSTAPLLNGSAELQRNANCHSVMSCYAHLSSTQDLPIVSQVKHEIETVKDPVVTAVLCDREPYVSKLDSNGQFLLEKGHDSDGSTKNSMQKNLGFDSVNDSCSSSKSNMEIVSDSIETEMDETCECSSSSAIVTDVISEKDFCSNFLRINGLLKGDFHAKKASVGDAFAAGDSWCHRSCKICGRLDRSLNLLICDNCEEAYHPSCCIPRMKKLPIDEWFCHSCLKKKRKILKETVISSPIINSEMGSSGTASVQDELNPILLMLKDTDTYSTSVRVGKGFQAEVPNWSGPIRSDDDDDLAEPLVFDTLEFSRLQDGNLRKRAKCSSIANWLQCQAIIDRTNGTLCGKWRRAPLFEVQTDDWECFCAIHWDPACADCAVPQEMDTQQVLKQLKYIEMLRPRLAARQHRTKGGEQMKDL